MARRSAGRMRLHAVYWRWRRTRSGRGARGAGAWWSELMAAKICPAFVAPPSAMCAELSGSLVMSRMPVAAMTTTARMTTSQATQRPMNEVRREAEKVRRPMERERRVRRRRSHRRRENARLRRLRCRGYACSVLDRDVAGPGSQGRTRQSNASPY
ncbi:hypothetical protein MPH_05920 [Macrophomina phaseolina MS6]|uniref:Uncharacterized protein n=1 Tax=Macrophomina phaseolina (strain MS6) TaxID=1126212 RepID=K2S347_MACPH|nr:hypothetical protein MPH_05920 [Macrophomina phaseolina MS6]